MVMLVARIVSATEESTEDELETAPEKTPFEEFPVIVLVAVATETAFTVSEALDNELDWIDADGSAA